MTQGAAVGMLSTLVGALTASFFAASASAQTYGFATLPPGSLSHVISSAVSKSLKDKTGVNVLVQPAAGGNVIVPMVGRGEVEIGIVNIMEVQDGFEAGLKDLRIIAAAHALRTPMFVRKDSGMRTIADLRGKRVTMGYSAMRQIDQVARAMLATAGLKEGDVRPVLVPNVVRSADDFVAGNADMFFFAFGGPKVREADASVGGIRALEIDPAGMPAARKIMAWGYLTDVAPGPAFTGVEKPMKIYSFDNVLITHAKVPDDLIYKVLDTMVQTKADLVAIAPPLQEFSAAFGYKAYGVPYHPGALKYFKEHGLTARPIE
ncbi:MAG: TAXI family TRAP transporter solute-binding subunit [Xanthobacteraceae bacterium]|nr:TAXI family TRAP transporter solute-binding subunit [Xanthobacteraceae bacterium]